MQIELREDSVHISGYVNAVERLSKPIRESIGGKIRTFLERIKAGVFRQALQRNDNVLVLLNHNPERVLASTGEGSALLEEDNIGLRADLTITDTEVVQKAREGKLSGWSFGFICNNDELSTEGTNELRTVTDLDLIEVSILDDTKEPAYYGTSIESRGGETMKLEIRDDAFAEKQVEVDVEELANMIADIILGKLKPEEEAKEEAEEEAEVETEETVEEAEEETEEETEEEPQEETEARAIDYSAFEERIIALKK